MTLVVLDPGFFREDGLQSPDPATVLAARQRLRERLDDANRILQGRTLVVGTREVHWLDEIYRREVRDRFAGGERALQQALDRMFRDHRRAGATLAPTPPIGAFWGVVMMADWSPLGGGWRSGLERVLAATAHEAEHRGVDALFLCHRILGRNAHDRSSGGVELVEVLRWRVSVSVRGAKPRVLPCVSQPRHLTVPWTRRMDGRLPDASGSGLHPYCPPPTWKHSATLVHRTAHSRPCWVDSQGQEWARPSTGQGYHWDVYLSPVNAARMGLSQINVTQHGAPPSQGRAGDLHHVPATKRHALKNALGWSCPR